MSDLDRENLKDERQPLTKKSVNQSDTVDKPTDTDEAAKAKKKKIIWGAVIILLIIGVILAIVLPLTLGGDNGGNGGTVNPFDSVEFNGFTVDQSTYQSTVWKAEFQIKQQKSSLSMTPNNAFMKLQDTLNGDSYQPANPQKVYNGTSNLWADIAQFNIDLVDNYQARVFIQSKSTSPKDVERRTVQKDIFQRPVLAWEARLSQLAFKVSNESFGFSFGNIYTGETIISTKNRKLLISDMYSEIGFVLPSQRCYGLGQRNGQFQLSSGMYTLHNKGRDSEIPVDARLGDSSGNHIHPFVLCQTKDTKDFFGMFFVSTAPQVFEVIKYGGYDQMILNYVTLGAPLEMYFIMRGKANEIISKYHAMVGYSQMPPYWALGHFQGSNAYSTWDQVSTVMSKYADSNIALEGVFIDNYNTKPHYTYTVDSTRYPDIASKVNDTHTANKRVIFGTSYALHNDTTDNFWYNRSYYGYQALIDSMVKMNPGKQVTGILDQTFVQYLDPFTVKAQGFFEEALPAFNTTVGVFDGLTVQDHFVPNEISGELYQTEPYTSEQEITALKRRRLDSPQNEESVGTYQPYQFNNDNQGEYPNTYDLPFLPSYKSSYHLDNKTISLNATHNNGKDKISELFVHNGNAHLSLKKTWQAWLATNDSTTKRPLLFSEASWAGSGAYSVALVTNLYRNWDSLRYLIDHVLGLSIAGMSNIMIDACHSLGPLDEELCGRTMQLAGFMPMVRNYYNATYRDPITGNRSNTDASESYNFKNISFAMAYSDGVSNKLKFSRYTYSQMYQVYREGGALVRPLFFDYPNDDKTFIESPRTFMLGDAIKVSPILDANVSDGSTYKSYFPAGIWIDLNDFTTVMNLTSGDYQSLNASYGRTNAYLKGGKIIPYIMNSDQKKTLTEIQKTQKTGFKVLRDSANAYAEGFVLVDDGESYRSYLDEKYTYWKLRYAEKSINFWVQYGNFDYEPEGLKIHQLDYIDILNAEDLANTNFACYMGVNLNPQALNYTYNNETRTLRLSPVNNADVSFKDIGFIKFGNDTEEPNFCDKSKAFTYTGAQNTSISNKTYLVYNITSNTKSSALQNLIVEFTLLDDAGLINVEITTQSDFESGKTEKYHVPTPDVYDLSPWLKTAPTKDISDFVKVYTENGFYYEIYKEGGKDLLWKSDVNHLYLDDYFIMDSGIFTANYDNGKPLMGMGERAGSIFYKNEVGGIHSRYTFDQANPIDDGKPPGRNFYGYQPFYAFQASTKDWVGVFDINTYATDYILYSDIGNNQTQIHKIAIGGTINKFFFVGTKIDDVIKKYQKLVGMPTVPPLWAFGWQQSRFGYVTSQDWWEVYQNYTQVFDIPLDVMWADIDYMDDYKLFTISPQSYADLPQKVQQIKADGRYFVPIMDAGVAVRENQGYKALDDGKTKDVFIKQSNQIDYLTAGVWCGNAYFPDFMKKSAVEWWQDNFDYLYKNTSDGGLGLQFDGVWLDENEATNFCNGYCKPEERPADSLRNKPFYVPGWRDLEDKALGVDGYHEEIQRHEYDVHNLYSLMQSKATADFLRKKLATSGNARPYVLSRSNYPGIGKHAHHWMGDNWSTVDYMAVSVDGVMSYNLFGLPFMGSDICGFNGDAAPDLCTKWHQLGSLYPFARNHNQNASASQEPYRFNTTIPGSSSVTYTDVIKTALINRYSLIHYYYSSFHSIYEFGGSFFKPLFYEFQDDVNTFDETQIQNNILLGEGLKASIQTQTLDFTNNPTTSFYFPADKWCQVLPYPDASQCWDTTTDSKTQTLNSGLEDYYVHIRGGHIIPWQNATKINARKTQDLVNNSIDFLVLPENTKTQMTLPSGAQYTANAIGYIYYDDGITYDDITRFELYLVNNGDKTATFHIENANKVTTKRNTRHENLGVLYIMGAKSSSFDQINKATIGGKDLVAPVYDSASDILKVNMTDSTGTVYNIYDVTDVQLSQP